MPDSQILPRGRMLLPVPLPDGALDDIRSRARRRKTERAAVTGSAAGVALVLAASVVLSGGLLDHRQDSLRIGPAEPVVDLPLQRDLAPQDDVLSPPTTRAERQVAGGKSAGSAVSAPAPAPLSPHAAPPAAAAPVQPDGSRQIDPRRHDPDAVRYGDQIGLIVPLCGQPDAPAPTRGWCVSSMVDTSTDVVGLMLCRAAGDGPGRLSWRDSQQVDFEVRDARGRTVWTYDPEIRPEPSSYEVSAERCVRWELTWSVHDEQGRALPSGDYTLRAVSTATTFGDAGVGMDVPFTVQPEDGQVEPDRPTPPPAAPVCTGAALPTSCRVPQLGTSPSS